LSKIALIGGGSTYSPAIVQGLVSSTWGSAIDEVWFMDTDRERATVMAHLSELLCHRAGVTPRLVVTGDRVAALQGAAFILLQIRAGGAEARDRDEMVPPTVGCVGDETIGAGGLGHAMRVMPAILDLARDAETACPEAWLLVLSNPTGIIVNTLLRHCRLKTLGLCDVPFDVAARLARALGVDETGLEVRTAGLNHGNYVVSVRGQGREMLPDILAAWDREHEKALGFPRDLVQALGVIPCYPYMRCYYFGDEMAASQKERPSSRAAKVAQWQREILDGYRRGPESVLSGIVSERQAPLYASMVTTVVGALSGRGPEVEANLTTENRGALSGLDAGSAVEVPCSLSEDACVPCGGVRLPRDAMALVAHIAGYEALAAEAAVAGADDGLLVRALLANPLVGTWRRARALGDMIREYNRRFAGPGEACRRPGSGCEGVRS